MISKRMVGKNVTKNRIVAFLGACFVTFRVMETFKMKQSSLLKVAMESSEGFCELRLEGYLCQSGCLLQGGSSAQQEASITWCDLFLKYFRNPYGTPRPTEPQNPPATKKEIPKIPKTPTIPKSKRSFPKSKRSFPKSKRSFPKVNVKYF